MHLHEDVSHSLNPQEVAEWGFLSDEGSTRADQLALLPNTSQQEKVELLLTWFYS